ncbi:hypothetical protein CPB86DRAFT_751191 [Serendipita vermifera]|nr:hypothetical protein CPB86DRAFT_751191 [Serendipita vermifera]
MTVGLISASITAFYNRDLSYLPSLPDLPSIPRLPNARSLVSGRTVFFGIICLVVILILAYVTNPSESSFRTFLTEQAFRRHLHKLHSQDQEEYGDEESLDYKSTLNRVRDSKGKQPAFSRHKAFKHLSDPSSSCFGRSHANKPHRVHFTSRLAISLQTPAHIFRNYGLCTIAVTQQVDTISSFSLPNSNAVHNSPKYQYSRPRHSNGSAQGHHSPAAHEECTGNDATKIHGTWYIGAFGRWWIGGELEFAKEDLMPDSLVSDSVGSKGGSNKIQREFKSGSYDIRPLDQIDAFEGLPLKPRVVTASVSASQSPFPSPSKHSSSKTRSRASSRAVKQTATPLPSRGSTPPPSNKTATPHSISDSFKGDNIVNGSLSGHNHPLALGKLESTAATDPLGEPQLSPDETTRSSDIAKLQQEISKSQTAVQELRDQLVAFQSQALASHASLRLLLDEQRSKKKQDDSTRSELKMRTKTLEENKRHADAGKRDAEKKLKAAQAAHDSAANRMQRLATEMENLEKKMQKGEERLRKAKEEAQQLEGECNLDIEKKRASAKEIEEGVSTLSVKTKELEEILAKEKERLAALKEEVEKGREQHKQQHSAWMMAMQTQQQHQRNESAPLGPEVVDESGDQQQQSSRPGFGPIPNQVHESNPLRIHAISSPFNPFEASDSFAPPHRRPSGEFVPMFESLPATNSASRLRSLSLGEVSSLRAPLVLNPKLNESRSSLKPGDDGFSPFDVDDRERVLPMRDNSSFTSLNMAAASLLPANLVNSIETESSVGSLNTNRDHPDTRTESRWRTSMWPFRSDNLSKSGSTPSDTTKRGFDPFESQRVAPPKSFSPLETRLTAVETTKPSTQVMRRWFSRSTTASTSSEPISTLEAPSQIMSAPEITPASKSRLNPDAKVFSLPKGRSLLSSALWTPVGVNMPPPTNIPPGPVHLLQIPEHVSSITSTSSLPILTPAPPSTSTTTTSAPKPRFRSLFTSPFAPSPAEREALQRALEKNLSYDRISQGSEGSGEGSSALRLPPSPFGLPQSTSPLFDVDEEADSGWGNVLKSSRSKRPSFGEAIARQTTR